MSQIPIITEEQANEENKKIKKAGTSMQVIAPFFMLFATIFLLFMPIVDVYQAGEYELSVSFIDVGSSAKHSIALMDFEQLKDLPEEISKMGDIIGIIKYVILVTFVILLSCSITSFMFSISKKSPKNDLLTESLKTQNSSMPLCIATILLGIVWGASGFLCSTIETLYLDGASKEWLKLFEIEIKTMMSCPFVFGAIGWFISFIGNLMEKNPISPTSSNQQTSSTAVDTEKGRVEVLASYKKLLDDGVITKEEFENKKEELLNQK